MMMIMTAMVVETSVQYVHLTRLIARENYIKVRQLFIDFKKAYDSVCREILYKILI
jgi:hypothetical protein